MVGGVKPLEERAPPQHGVHRLGAILLGLLAFLGGREPCLQPHTRVDGLLAPRRRRRHGELRALRPERRLALRRALRVRRLVRQQGAALAGHLLGQLLASLLGRAEPREHPLLLG